MLDDRKLDPMSNKMDDSLINLAFPTWKGKKNYTNIRQRNSILIGFHYALESWPALNSTLYLQSKKKKKRSFVGSRIVPLHEPFYKNLQMQRRRRTKDKILVVSQQTEEPFISVSVTLYLNCSFTSCAMKALSSVLIVVGPAWSLTSSAITALAFVLFFPLLTYNSDRAEIERKNSKIKQDFEEILGRSYLYRSPRPPRSRLW